MQRLSFLLLTIIISCAQFSAQDFSIPEQKLFGGNEEDYIVNIIECPDGGFYILSVSESGISGNKTTQNYGKKDYWLIKTDSLFNEEWQVNYGGSENDEPSGITIDNDNNLYILGTSNSPISGNKTVATYGEDDYWLIKLNSYGEEIWQHIYGGSDYDISGDILFSNNKIYLSGRSSSEISNTKTDFCRGSSDIWLISIDTAGNVLWDKTYGGTNLDAPSKIITSNNETLFLSGISNSDESYEKTENAIGGNDYWLLKINTTDGELLKDKTIGTETFFDIIRDFKYSNNSLFLLGVTDVGISGDKTDICRGAEDYWLLKINTDLEIEWDKTFGSDTSDWATNLLIQNDRIIIGGHSRSNAGFEKTEDSYVENKFDIWLIGLNENGNKLWDKIIGSSSNEFGTKLLWDSTHLIACANISDATYSFDFIGNSYGLEDIWVFRLDIPWSNAISNNSISKLEIYPNPSDGLIYINLENPIGNELSITVTDIQGRIVYKNIILNNELDLRELSEGMYYVEIMNNDKTSIQKIIID